MLVVSKGILHNTLANEEYWLMLFEQDTSSYLGDVIHEKPTSLAEQMPQLSPV
jgi:hypothetical protein